MIESWLASVMRWFKDPFDRGALMERHDQLLQEIKTTTQEAEQKLEKFPIGYSAGNQRLRRRSNHDERLPLSGQT